MTSQQRSTMRRQLDRRFKQVSRTSDLLHTPREGWVRTLRQALRMTLKDLANRMGVTEGTVRYIERAEIKRTITLELLSRAADALDCELVYVLIPRSSLEDTFQRQIRRRARSDARRTAATMALERQGLSVEETERQLEELIQDYLREPPQDPWHD